MSLNMQQIPQQQKHFRMFTRLKETGTLNITTREILLQKPSAAWDFQSPNLS